LWLASLSRCLATRWCAYPASIRDPTGMWRPVSIAILVAVVPWCLEAVRDDEENVVEVKKHSLSSDCDGPDEEVAALKKKMGAICGANEDWKPGPDDAPMQVNGENYKGKMMQNCFGRWYVSDGNGKYYSIYAIGELGTDDADKEKIEQFLDGCQKDVAQFFTGVYYLEDVDGKFLGGPGMTMNDVRQEWTKDGADAPCQGKGIELVHFKTLAEYLVINKAGTTDYRIWNYAASTDFEFWALDRIKKKYLSCDDNLQRSLLPKA